MNKFTLLFFFVLCAIISFGQSEVTDLVKLTSPKPHNNNKVLMCDDNGNLGYLLIDKVYFNSNSSNIPDSEKTEFTVNPKFKKLPVLKSQKVIVLDNQGKLGYREVSDLKKGNAYNSGTRGLEAKAIKLNMNILPNTSTKYNYIVVLGDDNTLGKRQLAELTGAMNDWDYLTVRYTWTSSAGTDLDIAVGFHNTNISAINNRVVGYRGGDTQGSPPYLEWAGDNTGDGGESVLFDPNAVYAANPTLQNTIELLVTCVWWNTKLTGWVTVELIAYKNGTMQKNGYIYENVGGREVSRQTITKVINATNTSYLDGSQFYSGSGNKVGKVIYNKSQKSAKFVKL